jgi:hypothetical protein
MRYPPTSLTSSLVNLVKRMTDKGVGGFAMISALEAALNLPGTAEYINDKQIDLALVKN